MWHLTSSETVESTTYLALHSSWYSPTYYRHKPHHLLLFSTCSRTPQDVFCKAAFNLLILTLQLLAVTAWLRCPTLHLPLLTQKVSAAHFSSHSDWQNYSPVYQLLSSVCGHEDGKQPCNVITQLSQDFQMHPIWCHGLVHGQFS